MSKFNQHWKSYTNPDYIGAYTFLSEVNGQVIATAKSFTFTGVNQESVTRDGGKEETEMVLSLKGESKKMVMNATNKKKLIELFGELCMFPIHWVGKSVLVNAVKVLERGQWVWRMQIIGLGVDETKATSQGAKKPDIKKPSLTPTHKSWNAVKAAIANGSYKIEQIKGKYFISPENEAILCENSK